MNWNHLVFWVFQHHTTYGSLCRWYILFILLSFCFLNIGMYCCSDTSWTISSFAYILYILALGPKENWILICSWVIRKCSYNSVCVDLIVTLGSVCSNILHSCQVFLFCLSFSPYLHMAYELYIIPHLTLNIYQSRHAGNIFALLHTSSGAERKPVVELLNSNLLCWELRGNFRACFILIITLCIYLIPD